MHNNIVNICFRTAFSIYSIILKLANRYKSKRIFPGNEPVEILITGTFSSDNWIISLLRPLALSSRCGCIRIVSIVPVPIIEKVEPVYPHKLLIKLTGDTAARLITFFWIGICTRPHIIGGLHLLLNGLTAILLAKLTGSRSLYNCCGGPTECMGGGFASNTRLFCKLNGPDLIIEQFLLEAINAADLVVTRGKVAVNYFLEHGISTRINIIPGGMDGDLFSPSNDPSEYDLIFIGRLVPMKRIDIFLQIVKKLHAGQPSIKAIILGDGPLRNSLETMADDLGLKGVVHFAGHQNNVAYWLRKAKIFVLTSESEGLSQSMIQAMLCGLPAVVSHVGEAGELVQDGINGFLIHKLDVDIFVNKIFQLLCDKVMLTNFSQAARRSAERCDMFKIALKWDEVLDKFTFNEGPNY